MRICPEEEQVRLRTEWTTYIEGIIILKQEFELSGKIAYSARRETEQDSSWGADVSGGRGDSDETSDGA